MRFPSDERSSTLNLLKTPPGTLQWPTSLDARDPTGLYVATLRLTPEEAAPLTVSIDAETEKVFAAARTDPRYAKKELVPRLVRTWSTYNDMVIVRFEAQEPPLLFDAQGNRIAEQMRVDLRARVCIAYTFVPLASCKKKLFGTDPRYFRELDNGVEVSVRLHLAAIQVLNPVAPPERAPAQTCVDRARRPLPNLPTETAEP